MKDNAEIPTKAKRLIQKVSSYFFLFPLLTTFAHSKSKKFCVWGDGGEKEKEDKKEEEEE